MVGLGGIVAKMLMQEVRNNRVNNNKGEKSKKLI